MILLSQFCSFLGRRKISREGAKNAKEKKKRKKVVLEEEIGREIVDSAIRVHQRLGPGLLEAVYEGVLSLELTKRGLRVERQVIVPLRYEGVKQLLTYLRLADLRLGYLLNFGEALMKDGITRTVHRLPNTSQFSSSSLA